MEHANKTPAKKKRARSSKAPPRIGGAGGTSGTCPDAGAEMPLAMIVDGIYANFLMEKDAHQVITEFQQPALPRYDYAKSG